MIQVTLPSGDVSLHGAGYPLTYRFTVPDQAGLIGQWSTDNATWVDLPAPPAYRADGVDMARFAGTVAYLSCAFPDGSTSLYLRVWDGAADVGAYVGVCDHYDDRAASVIFTYDDTTTTTVRAQQVHAANRLWMSPGINAARLGGTSLLASQLSAAVTAGYVEPINHGDNHVNPGTYASYADAQADIVGGKDRLLAVAAMPTQSRGRVHGFIYPNGLSNAYAYQACAEAGHLTARVTTSTSVSAESGSYMPGMYSNSYGLIPAQAPSVAVALSPTGSAIHAQKMIDAVNLALARRGDAHIYSYTYNWDLADGQPWQQAVATIGAMTNIWSVGYGHHALYRRTASRVAVRSTPAQQSIEIQSEQSMGALTVMVPPGIPGDLLVAVYRYNSAGRATALPGWELIADSSQMSGGDQTAVWSRRSDGTETTLALSPTQDGAAGWGCVVRYRNVRRFQPAISGWSMARRTSAGTQEVAPEVAGAAGLLLRIFSPTGGGVIQPPPGLVVAKSEGKIMLVEQAGPAMASTAIMASSSASGQSWTLVLGRFVPGSTPAVQSIGGTAVIA